MHSAILLFGSQVIIASVTGNSIGIGDHNANPSNQSLSLHLIQSLVPNTETGFSFVLNSFERSVSKLIAMATSGVTIFTSGRNNTCENIIRFNGHEYVCYERVDFLFVMALVFFVLFIFLTVVGNLLVVLAIVRDRRLRTPSTYLILSLAITDLIVGLITVPIRAFSEIKDFGTWPYGPVWCDLRVIIDKLCVYASLLHLVAIALDRYLTVSSLTYSLIRSGKQISYMISVVWGVAFALSVAPALGWRDAQYAERIRLGNCFVNTLFSLNLTVWLVIFVIPAISILILYYKVFQVVKNRIKPSDKIAKPVESISGQLSTQLTQTGGNALKMSGKNNSIPGTSGQRKYSTTSSTGESIPMKKSVGNHNGGQASNEANSDQNQTDIEQVGEMVGGQDKSLKAQRDRRETKAANTLVLITFSVIFCWLPFYTLYTMSSIFNLKSKLTSNFWFKISIWLGYFNSLVNPVIYVITNPYYRDAFKKIIFN